MKRSRRFLLTAAPLLVSSLALADDRPNFNAFHAAPSVAILPGASTLQSAPRATVASVDSRRGTPSFLWGDRAAPLPSSRTPEGAAREHIALHAMRYGLSPAALQAARAVAVHDIGRGGVLVTLRQSVGGIEVFHHDAKVLMSPDLRLIAVGGGLHAAAGSSKMGAFRLPEERAMVVALGDLYGVVAPASSIVRGNDLAGGYRAYELDASATALGVRLLSPARVKPVYFPLPDRLVPAYFVELSSRGGSAKGDDAYAYVVAADDGRVLYRENLTHAATFSYRLWADETGNKRPSDGPLVDDTPYPSAMPTGAFPGYAMSSLVANDGFNKTHDPWLADGATETRGNNVDAYTDDDQPDGFSAGDVRATVTSPGVFDYAYDFSQGPQANITQRKASVTSLFYTTNWLHDWWYDSGFDEAGHNAQHDNLGRGGIAGDPLLAEAQNGAPMERDNSNMSVFADGQSPRMQMFVWSGGGSLSVGVGGKQLTAGGASFGLLSFNVTASAVVVDDGAMTTSDACEPIKNDVMGKIAVIDRGNCTFEQKVTAAQTAGAVGVLIVDNKVAQQPPQMGGMGAMTTIPVLSVTKADGDALKASLASGVVPVTLSRTSEPDRDGTIDNTVVAHEWGHYLHLRNVACASAMCAAESEGWGDFIALMLVVRQGDNLNGAYALAQHATASFPDDPAYFGIRRYPYSVDVAKNALTFKHIQSGEMLPANVPAATAATFNDNAEVHAAGEIWASMLFESFVALLKRTEGATPAYTFDEARRRMSDYVVLGMKLAPADPSYTEQRDAILAAAIAHDPADAQAIAEAFARRGAGTCAKSPAHDSTSFAGVVESFTVQPNASLESVAIDDSITSCDGGNGVLDAGETGKVTVTLKNAGTAPLDATNATVTTTTPGLTFPGGTTLAFGVVAPFTTATTTIDVALDASAAAVSRLDVSVALVNAASCATTGALVVAPLTNYDEATNAATVDSVEAKATAWTKTGDVAEKVWSRTEIEGKPGEHAWLGADYSSPSDTSLVSPPLVVSATDPLTLSFRHRYQFESSMGAFYDGGVIEISSDGATWQDISMFADPGYGGVIGDPKNGAKNVLKGRNGYVNHNAAYPEMDTTAIALGTAFAGKTIQVRFRIATDDAQGAFGWQIDDIAVSGITNTPFTAIVADQTACSNATGASGAAGAGGATSNGGSGTVSPNGGASGAAGSSAGGHTANAGNAGATGTLVGGGSPSGTGNGEDVGIEGGAGCGVASTPARGPWAALFVGAAALVARRRKSRSMRA